MIPAPSGSPEMQLHLLGPPQVEVAGRVLTIARRQVRALLYVLAVELEPIARTHLCFLFWPDSPDAAARRNLSHLLTHLRKVLPDPGLLRLSEDDGTPLFPHAMVFDAECVESNDTYAQLLWQIADAAGTRDRFTEVHCDLHFGPGFADNPVGEMSYLCGGQARHLDIAVEGEWADPDVVRQLFEDATPEGHRWVSTGDYGIHVWPLEEHAAEVARIFATEDTAAEARIAGHLHRERHGG